ncbi:hypothetical protein D3C86_1883420 [compost metagenome]
MPRGHVLGAVTMGASLVLSMVRVKLLLAVALPPSVAVTLTLRLPTSPLPGVPLKLPLAGSKRSQPGNGSPLARLAL